MGTSVAELLKKVGSYYATNFDDAILNFEKEIKSSKLERKSIIKLSDNNKKSLTKLLIEHGFTKIRSGGKHEIWRHSSLNKNTPVPRHNELTMFVARSILNDIKEAAAF